MKAFVNCRSRTLAVLLVVLFATTALAHPGSGIVVDKRGQVFFADTGSGLWKIDAHGALIQIPAPRFHWLALDEAGGLKSVRLPSGPSGEITRVGDTPHLLLASDYPLATGGDGNLYYPSKGQGGNLDVVRLTPSGRRSVLTRLHLPYVNGLASGELGSLYFTENDAVRRISAEGTVSTIVTKVSLSGCASIPGNDPNDPLLRGLAVDAAGTTYVAASGCGQVLKVTRDGKIATLLQTESPWSPTAVALSGQDVYVLEYLHTA